ncbi:acyltransferase family protein [Chryseobacterium sp. Leaf201]|uniref:acyltransferase family protein n=1 Tax=Chryseobacterium sp. Leaf201 TaxID=1735672 RepID=UPI0012FF559A|nr:acyltransferase [Chryseobacterium sp. Leaf201]
MKKIYPNLNSLRFIAALLVIVFHIELHKYLFKLPNLYSYGFFQIIGKLGVVLFFVLSGFLITSLLLNEKVSTKNIHIKNFYIRRILRIWPLYYLIIIISFYVIPYIPILTHPDKTLFPDTLTNTYPTIFYYLTIFANLAVPMFNHVAYASQTWSIATEEQFYLI